MASSNLSVTGKCRCVDNPVRFEYTKAPFEFITAFAQTHGYLPWSHGDHCGRGKERVQDSPGQ